MFALAHFSDPHLPLPEVSVADLLSKRLTGYLSWQNKRRHIHVPQALETVLADIRASAPNHIALTGDIANISLPQEFEQAARWLAGLAGPHDLTVVPGNHDRYVAIAWADSLALWADYMSGDRPLVSAGSEGFPFVRRRGPVALIGLSTAIATPPFSARGRLQASQISALADLLPRLAEEGLCRIVLIHHPPHARGASWRKELADGPALRQVLRQHGAELLLHGHNHRTELACVEGPAGAIPVLGAISASAAHDSPYGRAGWNLIRIDRQHEGWRFRIEHRRLTESGKGCEAYASFDLMVAAPVADARPQTATHQGAVPQ